MNSPLISFVIPNYNYGRYLTSCIDSCLQHDSFSYEICVQDAASNDESVEILRSYGDKISWVSEADDGQSDAINQCIQRAQGEYIAWINSDDYYPPTKPMDIVAETIHQHPEVDLIYGNGLFVVENDQPYRLIQTPRPMNWKQLAINPFAILLQPSLIFRRSLFLDCGGLDTSLHYAMDIDLWIRFFMQHSPVQKSIPTTLAHARIHQDAKTTKHAKRTIQEINYVLKRHSTYQRLSLLEKLQATYYQMIVWLYLMKCMLMSPSLSQKIKT